MNEVDFNFVNVICVLFSWYLETHLDCREKAAVHHMLSFSSLRGRLRMVEATLKYFTCFYARIRAGILFFMTRASLSSLLC